MLIKLRMIKKFTNEEIGSLLLDADSIEAVEDYGSPLVAGSYIRLKPVVNGFHDNDQIYKMQNEYYVAESLATIHSLINSVKSQKES